MRTWHSWHIACCRVYVGAQSLSNISARYSVVNSLCTPRNAIIRFNKIWLRYISLVHVFKARNYLNNIIVTIIIEPQQLYWRRWKYWRCLWVSGIFFPTGRFSISIKILRKKMDEHTLLNAVLRADTRRFHFNLANSSFQMCKNVIPDNSTCPVFVNTRR